MEKYETELILALEGMANAFGCNLQQGLLGFSQLL